MSEKKIFRLLRWEKAVPSEISCWGQQETPVKTYSLQSNLKVTLTPSGSMRVGILRFNQKREEKPWLHTSKTKAKVLVESGFFEWVSKSIILELVENAIQKKDPAREFGSKVKVIPRLLPPLLHEGSLNLGYPVCDMTSYRREFGYYQNWSTFKTELPTLERIDV